MKATAIAEYFRDQGVRFIVDGLFGTICPI